MDHRLREKRSRRRAVARDVVRLRRDFLDELCAHVLERIFKLDVLRDRHAVVRDRRCAELLVENDVAALGAERDLYGIRQSVDALAERTARFFIEQNLLCHGKTS